MPPLRTRPYEGLLSNVLDGLVTVLDENKSEVGRGIPDDYGNLGTGESPLEDGLAHVEARELQNGWNNPAAFVLGGPQGAPIVTESGARGLHDHQPDVTVVVVSRTGDGSDELAVARACENIADIVHREGKVGGAYLEMRNPVSLGRRNEGGNSYSTVGLSEFDYSETIERTR